MTTIGERLSILGVLSNADEWMRPGDIGELVDLSPLDAGRILKGLLNNGLVDKAKGKPPRYLINDKGTAYLENPPEYDKTTSAPPTERKDRSREQKQKIADRLEGATDEMTPERTAITHDVAVPSQADLFRGIGERLRIGVGRGGKQEGTPLDAVIYYVQATADLDNLSSVWNALIEMGIATDVRKRWIKLYAQTIPGKQIPDDLKDKLETGMEADKLTTGAEAIPPKPKRFSIVGGVIIGDPEGDLTFKEALQYLAQERGASPDEARSMALELSKMGPEMLATILAAITPLIGKDSSQGNAITDVLQVLKDMGAIGKSEEGGVMKTIEVLTTLGLIGQSAGEGITDLDRIEKLAALGFIPKPGSGEPDAVKELRQEVVSLKDALARKDMESLTNELTAVKGALSNIRQELEVTRRDQSAKGEFDIMSQAIAMVDRRMQSLENVVSGALRRAPAPLTIKEKKRITDAIEQEVEAEENLQELGATLWPKGG